VPLVHWPHGNLDQHVIVCMLHCSISLGRLLCRWVTQHCLDCNAFAASVGIRRWSEAPKGEDSRLLIRNFHAGVHHLVPGSATPALVSAVTNLGWAVARLTFAYLRPGDPELANRDSALRQLPVFVRQFRQELGLHSKYHYLWYLEHEIPRFVVPNLVWLGTFQGWCSCFSFAQASFPSWGCFPPTWWRPSTASSRWDSSGEFFPFSNLIFFFLI
jgi:hypothetical protein